MTIIKQHTSPDGYKCRLRKMAVRNKRWEIFFKGKWRVITEVVAMLPGEQTPRALLDRVRKESIIVPNTSWSIKSTLIELRGKEGSKRAYPSEWFYEWAKVKGLDSGSHRRGRFIRTIAEHVDAGKSPSEALKLTMKTDL